MLMVQRQSQGRARGEPGESKERAKGEQGESEERAKGNKAKEIREKKKSSNAPLDNPM